MLVYPALVEMREPSLDNSSNKSTLRAAAKSPTPTPTDEFLQYMMQRQDVMSRLRANAREDIFCHNQRRVAMGTASNASLLLAAQKQRMLQLRLDLYRCEQHNQQEREIKQETNAITIFIEGRRKSTTQAREESIASSSLSVKHRYKNEKMVVLDPTVNSAISYAASPQDPLPRRRPTMTKSGVSAWMKKNRSNATTNSTQSVNMLARSKHAERLSLIRPSPSPTPEESPSSSSVQEEPVPQATATSKVMNFPHALFQILADESTSSGIIEWLPCGKNFVFLSKESFATNILPIHFAKCKMPSFTRKLCRWGFKFDRDHGTYSHPHFVKDNPRLMAQMHTNEGKLRRIMSIQPGDSRDFFLQQLWKILSHKDSINIIEWLPNGNSFIIWDSTRFLKVILSNLFGGNYKLSSFVRQLYRWGFKLLQRETQTTGRIYAHNLFRRDCPALMNQMRRHQTTPSGGD